MTRVTNRKKHILLLVLLLPLAAGLVVLFLKYIKMFTLPDEISRTLDLCLHIIEVLGVLIAIILTLQELIASKEISRATFIVGLNQSYVDNAEYMRIYNFLQAEYDRSVLTDQRESDISVPPESCENSLPLFDCESVNKGAISNYLTFFETIYILYQRNVISFDVIDDLFAYRFFLAVHSKLFQDMKLCMQPENFKNIYKLEKEWLDHRVQAGKMTREERERNTTDPREGVYTIRQLRFMLNDDDRYRKLLQ